jgi:hypothetical protein
MQVKMQRESPVQLSQPGMNTTTTLLDCESLDSARNSLARLFNCIGTTLERFLADPAFEATYVKNARTLPSFDDYLYGEVVRRFGTPAMPARVCWFHCTRVTAGTNFSEGILPLSAALPRLKELLLEVVQEPKSRELVRQVLNNNGGYAFHFREKTSNDIHAGPYAILVRDVAFHTKALGQHDYLSIPEIIEDLCSEVKALANIDLTEHYQAALRPTIVKFTTAATGSARRHVATALCYVWAGLHNNGKPDGNSVWCFDGENVTVPARDILEIQYLKETPSKLGQV